jgi:hypothetical protein
MRKLSVNYKVAVYGKNKMITITDADGRLLISYDKKVAFIGKDGRVHINTRWYDCSKTTLSHLAAFLGEGKAQVDAKLAAGEYYAVDDMVGAAA